MTRLQLPTFNSTSQTVALASLLSFGAQVLFALLMLRWFTPQEVGEFSVISQIAFFWMTLALAQAPLTLLANQLHETHREARRLWRNSLLRGLALTPLVLLGMWVSQLPWHGAIVWILLIALCQLSWALAQSFVLRTGMVKQQLFVRAIPPLTSLLVACLGSLFMPQADGQGKMLLSAALIGYFVGSLWLLPAWSKPVIQEGPAQQVSTHADSSNTSLAYPQADNRSDHLRMIHTFFDVLLATAIILVWQRQYGTQETGWLSALLRVFGFVPAIIHVAWSQVMLSNPKLKDDRSLFVGFLGWLALVILCFVGLFSIQNQWLEMHWHGMVDYFFPLALWQGSACLSACISHRPFKTGFETQYSLACIGIASLQLFLLLAPTLLKLETSPQTHFICFSVISSICLLLLAKWMHSLR